MDMPSGVDDPALGYIVCCIFRGMEFAVSEGNIKSCYWLKKDKTCKITKFSHSKGSSNVTGRKDDFGTLTFHKVQSVKGKLNSQLLHNQWDKLCYGSEK